MHVLGHGFGSRRKSSTRRPRDLHIRKVSFSGSSLSSGCSLSSSTSSTPTATPTARTPTNTFRPEIDPLQLNPSFHAPPRLYERPFKNIQPLPEVHDNDENIAVTEDAEEQCPAEKAMPCVSPEEDLTCETHDPSDYFFTALAPPPPPHQPRASPINFSRWSESTVATLDFEANQDEESEEEDAPSGDDEDDVLEMRRLSQRASRQTSHRAAALQTLSLNITYTPRPANAPKRPPMRSLDSVDNYIRRGGWKRRGIVFRAEDAEDMETVTRQVERASF